MLFLAIAINANAQLLKSKDTTDKIFTRTKIDTSTEVLNMDVIYNRPSITIKKIPIAIGGYIETNGQYSKTDGVGSGFDFQFRRLTLLFSSSIAKKIKFLSEIEFEEGTKEISIESAILDIEFHPLLNLRSGIIINPIGGFNQNHDGPRWDFIDRPISATEIIPSTLSNVGVGFYGKYAKNNWVLGYETYITNGFDDKLIDNEDNRTSFHESKENIDKFSKSNSGIPMFTGKIAVKNRKIGELGFSYLTGVYNQWKRDGLIIDDKRKANILAVDFNTSFFNNRLNITSEVAKTFIQVPSNYIQTYGTQQLGTFFEIVGIILQHKFLNWENGKLNLGFRCDYVDFNQDKFRGTGDKIYDQMWAITPSIAYRPVANTVLRFNYKYEQYKDLFGNPPSKTSTIQFGIATYF